MSENIETINKAALDALCQDDFYQAQTLFRKNAKINPSHVSFNNLGVFYVFEGIQTQNNKYREAKKLGVSYLKKAIALQPLKLSYLALGHVCIDAKDYNSASRNFTEANAFESDNTSLHNLALSYYKGGMYKEALFWFEKALHGCSKSDYFETFASYLFSLLQVDKKRCREEMDVLFDNDTNDIAIERFTLAYLCGDMQLAEHQIEKMLKYFDVGLEVTAMVFDCLISQEKADEAERHLKCKIQFLEETGDNYFKQEIERYKKLFLCEAYRKEIIASFRYTVPLIAQCCYYGCTIHNPY